MHKTWILNKIHLSSFGLTQKLKFQDNTILHPFFWSASLSHISPIHVPSWSLVTSSASAAWSRLLEIMQLLQHLQSWRIPTLSLVFHTQIQSPREQPGHTRKSKAPQKFKNNESQGTNVTAAKAYNLGPNSCTWEHFPNKSYLPKQKHLTVKTHIEVINRRPKQKRSVSEDRVHTEKKGN